MLTLLPAVVGGEEDVGVLELASGFELLDQRGHHLVDGQHRLQTLPVIVVYVRGLLFGDALGAADRGRLVGDVFLVVGRGAGNLLLGERPLVALGGGGGSVGSGGGHVREEGLVLWSRSPNEVGGLSGEDVGKEVPFLAAVGYFFAILVDAIVVELLPIQLAVPLVPARRDVGRVAAGVPVEILAEEGSLVTLLLQADGDGVLLVPLLDELLKAPGRVVVAYHVVVVVVEAGEDGCPRGAAHRVAHEGLLEREALFGQQGADLGHLLYGGVVQVVGEDEEDVGLGRGFFRPL